MSKKCIWCGGVVNPGLAGDGYYRWLYRQKLGTDTNVPANAPDTNIGKMEGKK